MKREYTGEEKYSKQSDILELINLKKKEENILKKLKISNKYNNYIDVSNDYIKMLEEKHHKLQQNLNQVFENVDLMTYIFSFIDHREVYSNENTHISYCKFSSIWKTAILNNIQILLYDKYYTCFDDSDESSEDEDGFDTKITRKEMFYHNTVLNKLEILSIQNINELEKIINLKISFPKLKILFIEDLNYYELKTVNIKPQKPKHIYDIQQQRSIEKLTCSNVKGRKILNTFIKNYPNIKIYIHYSDIEYDKKKSQTNMKHTKTYKMENYEKTYSITTIDLYKKIIGNK